MEGKFTYYVYDLVDGMSSSYSYIIRKGKFFEYDTKKEITDPETIETIKEKIASFKKTGCKFFLMGKLP